jgi:hypothetical protein
VLGATILIVATAAISAVVVSNWNPFPPKDYEDCASRAARDAKSKDALSVLLSICASEFKGRRKPGGGYTYFDSCQDRSIDIKEPNPTTPELNDINYQCLLYTEAQERVASEQAAARARQLQAEREARLRAQQAEQEGRARAQQAAQDAIARLQARKWAAIQTIRVTLSGFEYCEPNNLILGCTMKIEVTNGSKEALSKLLIGLATASTVGAACPSSYGTHETLNIGLSPGEKRAASIDLLDKEFSKHPLCIKAIDVDFVGN